MCLALWPAQHKYTSDLKHDNITNNARVAVVVQLRLCRTHRQRLPTPEKKQQDVRLGQRASHQNVSLDEITVDAVKIIAICGQIGSSKQEVLLDSGSGVSLERLARCFKTSNGN